VERMIHSKRPNFSLLQSPMLVYILLFLLVIASLAQSFKIYRIENINQALSSPQSIEINEHTPAQLVFAKAWYLENTGQFQEALRLYNRLDNSVDKPLFESVKYNMGTLYLKQAAKHWNSKGVWAYSQVNTWTGLAEQAFREVLNKNPNNWDARYNLEYALRIKPPLKEVDKADWTGHKSSVHSIYPGIPGGSP